MRAIWFPLAYLSCVKYSDPRRLQLPYNGYIQGERDAEHVALERIRGELRAKEEQVNAFDMHLSIYLSAIEAEGRSVPVE